MVAANSIIASSIRQQKPKLFFWQSSGTGPKNPFAKLCYSDLYCSFIYISYINIYSNSLLSCESNYCKHFLDREEGKEIDSDSPLVDSLPAHLFATLFLNIS